MSQEKPDTFAESAAPLCEHNAVTADTPADSAPISDAQAATPHVLNDAPHDVPIRVVSASCALSLSIEQLMPTEGTKTDE